MSRNKSLSLVGYASGVGGAGVGSREAIEVLKHSSYFSLLSAVGVNTHWEAVVPSKQAKNLSRLSKMAQITELCYLTGMIIAQLVQEKKFFALFGGDHSCAIGTWSGVSLAKKSLGPIGLIWIDAHMDSHTPESSPTGNIHGMPLATLLGYGETPLTKLLHGDPKLRPEHVCIIGVRSYEPAEAELLKKLNIRVFFMDEINQKGLSTIFAEAVKIVTNGTSGYGISLDLDSIDPEDAPGTGTIVPNGIHADELFKVLTSIANDSKLLGVEIVEFDPTRDKNHLTEKLITKLLAAVLCVENEFNAFIKNTFGSPKTNTI